MIQYQETPFQEINDILLKKAGVRLLVKREDLNHREVSGNKWWKLKYNLEEAIRLKHQTLLTFGGAYSNHIYSTAAACNELGLKSIGIIRGEEERLLNHRLAFAKQKGMRLKYVSREEYRRKTEPELINKLQKEFGEFYLLPEGGTNELALRGCAEFANKIQTAVDFNYLCLPVGTGGTMAGMIAGLAPEKKVIGFSALKGGSFLEEYVSQMLKSYTGRDFENWNIETGYHFGGYGKSTEALEGFITTQNQQNKLPLDSVYTGKMIWGIYDMVKKRRFEGGTTVVAIHTGGLQTKFF